MAETGCLKDGHFQNLEVEGTCQFSTTTITAKNSTDSATLQGYSATITVSNGAAYGKEAAIGMPANFIPLCVSITVTSAATNDVNLVDLGPEANPDGYIDGANISVNSTGFKGIFGLNGVAAASGGAAPAAVGTADEVKCTLNSDPGADTVIRFTFFGFVGKAIL